jgi:EmrB/QacA subfamily drug resistance transporter
VFDIDKLHNPHSEKNRPKKAKVVANMEGKPETGKTEEVNKWIVLAIVAIGVFMATLDTSIVNISLPTIARYFNVPLNGLVAWVVIAYLVVSAALLLTAGRLADMIGRKWVWVTGLIIFTISSALCGAAPSLELLIAARALQGLGSALTMAVSPSMLTAAFSPRERGKALGINAVIVSLGVSSGPTLGGLITENFSWRWIFLVNIPLGVIGIAATLLFLTEKSHQNPSKFDPVGAVLLALGLASLTLGLSFGQEWGWTSLPIIGLGLTMVVTLVGLVMVERRISNPVIALSLFQRRNFVSANVSQVLSFVGLFAVSFMLPFYFEQLRGFSTEESGLLLTPLPLTIAFIAPLSGSLADRIGTRWLATAGLIIAGAGLILLAQINAQSSVWDIVWRLILIGAGQAIFQTPNNSALMGAAPRSLQGSAAGMLATGRVVGQSLSVALAGAIFASLGGAQAGSDLVRQRAAGTLTSAQTASLDQTFLAGFQLAFMVCAGVILLGVGVALVRDQEQR